MLVQKLFGDAAISRVDFQLKRPEGGSFVLAVLAVTDDEHELTKNVKLDTTEFRDAIQRSIKCMNDIAGDLRPGLEVSEEAAMLGLATGGISLRKGGPEDLPLPDKIKAIIAGLEGKGDHHCSCGSCSCGKQSTEEIYERVKEIAAAVHDQMQELFNIVSELLSERD